MYSLVRDASLRVKQLLINLPHDCILVVGRYPVEQTSHNELFAVFNTWQSKIDHEHMNCPIRTIMNKAIL